MTLTRLITVALITALVGSTLAKTYLGVPGVGRNLLVRALPPVPDFQSPIYELYQETLPYDPLRPLTQAVVTLTSDGEAGASGELTLTQWAPGGPVLIQGNITGLSPGLHGLYVATSGDLRDGCKSTGRHFNPFLHRHGGPRDAFRHLGDLGNVRASDDGVARVQVKDHLISLHGGGARGVAGRALVVAEREDDLGRAATEESAIDGGVGAPVACGIIGLIN